MQFIHLEEKKLVELETINENNQRLYVTPEGKKYPSVTTVLEVILASILEWRKRVGDEVANKISRQASARGSRFHYQCEDYLNNKSPKIEGPGEKSMFSAIEPFLKRINNIHLQEKSLYSDHLQTAGQIDCIAEFDGRLSVIDFKTSSKPKSAEWITNYFCQGSAYAVMYEERTGIPIDTVTILMAVEGNDAQLFQVKRDDFIEKYIDIRKRYKDATTLITMMVVKQSQ